MQGRFWISRSVFEPRNRPQLTLSKLCRDRKVKCGGEQPQCRKCLQAGEQCVYMPVQRPTKADLAQTVESLQKRLGEFAFPSLRRAAMSS